MDSKQFGYARVSTKEQKTDRQVIALTEYGVEERNIIVDKESGKDLNRNGYPIKIKPVGKYRHISISAV